MTPVYFRSGRHTIAGIFEPATGAPKDSAILLVPPLGWDDQTSYRPRRDWSLALSAAGFANLRIDLPGSGDSSGTARDCGLVDAWARAISHGAEWLRAAGARRVAVIALGGGGLVSLQAIARGAPVDDLVIWGMPTTGRALVREIKAFARLEQFQTGELPEDVPEGALCAGGHPLSAEAVDALGRMNAPTLISEARPNRALVLGRDGTGAEQALLNAFREAGSDVRSDPGQGWGAAVGRPQSVSPDAIFATVNDWLWEGAQPGQPLKEPESAAFDFEGVRERAVLFEGGGQQLYAVIAEPAHAPATGTVVLFNAGAIRRIGPNRMWTEAARRWAAAGVAVIRLDVEGIGDAAGENSAYIAGDESFYVPALTIQARAALDLAEAEGLPDRFLLAGLCAGAFWSFEAAVADPRVEGIVMLNPRLLAFDPHSEGDRELRKIGRIFTRRGFGNLLREKRKMRRLGRFATHLLRLPLRVVRRGADLGDRVTQGFRTLYARGQNVDIAFSGDEPLHDELRDQGKIAELEAMGVRFHPLPYTSHTLKPLKAQAAANAILDEAVERLFPSAESASAMRVRRQA